MNRMNRFLVSLVAAAVFLFSTISWAADARPSGILYKNPSCGCCESYADYLRDNGISVDVRATHDLLPIKRRLGVSQELEGCHTMVIDGYVVEGHVPVQSLRKLLTERPAIKGISLPGMPTGSPGMDGPKSEPFTILEIGEGPARVFAVE